MIISPKYRTLKTVLRDIIIKICYLLNTLNDAIQKHLLKETLEQIRFNKNLKIPTEKMDKNLLGQYIRFIGHKIEKAVRNEYQKGRGLYRQNCLKKALAEWQRRGYPDSHFIEWAEQNVIDYDRWREFEQPQIIPVKNLPTLEENSLYLDVIFTRSSIRFWENRHVETEKLKKIVKAATYAPSSCNRQAWKFYIEKRDGKIIDNIVPGVDNQTLIQRAPVIIYIAIDQRLYDEKFAAAIDAGVVALQMSLTAHLLGLGNCLMYGSEEKDQKEIRKKHNIPDFEYIYLLLLMGYPAESTIRNKRVNIEEVYKII